MIRRYTKEIYISIVIVAAVCLFGSYIPGLQFLAKWCTPPVMLFLGLVYALICGQGTVISGVARKCLTLTMFFIGASLSTDVIRTVGIKPLILGILLWIVISVGSLLYIVL